MVRRSNQSLPKGVMIVFLICLVNYLPGQLSSPNLVMLDLQSGLSNEYVRGILQDQEGFIWVATAYGLNRYDGYDFVNFIHNPNDPSSLSDNNVWTLYEDRAGNLWVGTAKGLDLYQKEQNSFLHFFPHEDIPEISEAQHINAIFEDSKDSLWIGSSVGLLSFNRRHQSFHQFSSDDKSQLTSIRDWVWCIFEDKYNNLWIGTQTKGLYGKRGERIEHFIQESQNPQSLTNNWIRYLFEDEQDRLWVGTQNGLNLFHPDLGIFSRYRVLNNASYHFGHLDGSSLQTQLPGSLKVASNPDSITGAAGEEFTLIQRIPKVNAAKTICRDFANGIWAKTWGSGVAYASPNHYVFRSYQLEIDKSLSSKSPSVKAFFERENGDIWIGTPKGLYLYERKKERFTFILPGDISCVAEDHQRILWAGVFKKGLMSFPADEFSQPRITWYLPDPSNPNSVISSNFTSIQEDHIGDIWIGAYDGLSRYSKAEGSFVRYLHQQEDPHSLSSNWVWCIFEEKGGVLWVGTNLGLNRYDREQDEFVTFFADKGNPNGLSDDFIWSISPHSNEYLWLGTKVGLNLFHPDSGTSKSWQTKDGLPNDFVGGIIEDPTGKIWLNTINSISRFDPEANTFLNYGIRDGLHSNTVIYGAKLVTQSGEVLYGDRSGFTLFHPNSIVLDSNPPPVVLTDFRINNKSLPIEGTIGDTMEWRSPLQQSITFSRQVVLPFAQNDFSINFAALSFQKPEQNQYAYRLLGYKNDWINTDASNRVASFTNLSSGTYTFEVKAANHAGFWNENVRSLQIIILSPWWSSWWAYLFYILTALLIIYSLYLYLKQRWQLQHQVQLEHQEAERLKELDHFKTRFYTHITHEFRTPLTIILGMINEIEQKPSQWLRKGTDMIRRNGNYLLKLVNQMLDMARLDAGAMPLNLVHGDLLPYLRYLVEAFHSLASSRKIMLSFESSEQHLEMDYDPGKIRDILSNLLSNAIKFTPENGEVIFRLELTQLLDNPYLKIEVADSGCGIPESSIPFIFDRFHQVPSNQDYKKTDRELQRGTGIGLALTQELVQLLEGEIQVESALGVGTTFTVLLPIRKSVRKMEVAVGMDHLVMSKQALQEIEKHGVTCSTKKKLPLVLVVEDHPDVVTYLSACLQDKYELAIATNGQMGIEKAFELIPDVILSDVMMPEKDGFELCEILKQDQRTSHVPIILLTAKVDVTSRLDGLSRGADAYLAKPFSKAELEVRLEKIIELRKRLQERYSNQLTIPTHKDKGFAIEDSFIRKVQKLIESNLEKEDFDLTQLSQTMAMSRTQLYRKLHAITGQGPSQYLRAYRLHRARILLLETDLNISEIAFRVGFKDLSHFSRSFKIAFQQSPTEMRSNPPTSFSR